MLPRPFSEDDLHRVRLYDRIVAVVAAIEDAVPLSRGVDEEVKVVAQKIHLGNGFLQGHVIHDEPLHTHQSAIG